MLQRILLVSVLCIVFAGCHSEEYTRAYEHAKEEGKSVFYAKAYAEQIAEGKGKIYAEAYAFALELHQKATKDKDKPVFDGKVFARIFAEKKYAGHTSEYAGRYTFHYCLMLLVAKKKGQDERFVHRYVKYYFDVKEKVKRRFPHYDSKYITAFSERYAWERALGTTSDQAVEKALVFVDSIQAGSK